jgi:hypothetical protein
MGIASLGRRDWGFDTEDSANFGEQMRVRAEKLAQEKGDNMAERPHCEKHQRYLNATGACIDCENQELVFICAQDIVKAWPDLSIRTLGQMTKRIDTLRQALEAAKR